MLLFSFPRIAAPALVHAWACSGAPSLLGLSLVGQIQSLVCHFFAPEGEKNDTQGIESDQQAKVLIMKVRQSTPTRVPAQAPLFVES